jgi:probable F420-dependent oxidoreductase
MSGVVIPYWLDRPATEAVEIARVADREGFDELWVGELYHYDAFALAGFVVAATQSITPVIGPVAAGVRDPVTIARGVATVATLGGRPARLALGASNRTMVERFHGRPFGAEAERMRSTAEAVRAQLETGRSPTGYRSALGPVGAHISIAAFGHRMVGVAAEVADRMVVNLVTPEQAATLAGGAPGIPTVAWLVAALEPGADTHREVSTQVAHYLAAPGYAEMFADAGFATLVDRARDRMPIEELARIVPVELLAAVGLYGSKTDNAARANEYRDAGVEIALVPATAEDPAGEKTLAALRMI